MFRLASFWIKYFNFVINGERKAEAQDHEKVMNNVRSAPLFTIACKSSSEVASWIANFTLVNQD